MDTYVNTIEGKNATKGRRRKEENTPGGYIKPSKIHNYIPLGVYKNKAPNCKKVSAYFCIFQLFLKFNFSA